jgi:hypothetical protein
MHQPKLLGTAKPDARPGPPLTPRAVQDATEAVLGFRLSVEQAMLAMETFHDVARHFTDTVKTMVEDWIRTPKIRAYLDRVVRQEKYKAKMARRRAGAKPPARSVSRETSPHPRFLRDIVLARTKRCAVWRRDLGMTEPCQLLMGHAGAHFVGGTDPGWTGGDGGRSTADVSEAMARIRATRGEEVTVVDSEPR